MTKKEKLRACDIALLIVAVLVFLSSVQMEATAGRPFYGVPFEVYMAVHVVLAVAMMVLVGYHLYLHFGWRKWVDKFRKMPKPANRLLAVCTLLTLVTGAIALVMLLVHMSHTSFGGVHGKIGFVMLAIAVGHTVKRANWFKR